MDMKGLMDNEGETKREHQDGKSRNDLWNPDIGRYYHPRRPRGLIQIVMRYIMKTMAYL